METAEMMPRPTSETRNRYPQWGPLCRIWDLLDDEDVRHRLASGQPPEVARLAAGATRRMWEPFVSLPLALNRGFEPVIGTRHASRILEMTRKSLWLAEKQFGDVPAYRDRQRGRNPSIVYPLCQLVRWAEKHMGWERREGW